MANKVVMLSISAGSNDVRIMKEATSLVKLGLEVTVIAKREPGFSEMDWVDGVKVVRVEKIASLKAFSETSKNSINSTRKMTTIEKSLRESLKRLPLREPKATQAAPKTTTSAAAATPAKPSVKKPETVERPQRSSFDIHEIKKDPKKIPQELKRFLWLKKNKAQAITLGIAKRQWRRLQSYTNFLSLYFITAEEMASAIISEKPDFVHAHDLYTLPAAVRGALEVGAKVVYDAHEFERYRRPYMSALHRQIVKTLEETYAPHISEYITVSDSIAEEMAKNLGITTPTVIFNAPPTIDWSNSNYEGKTLKESVGLQEEDRLGVFVGKCYDIFNHDHKIHLLIEALAFTPGIHFAILGFKAEGVVEAIEKHAETFGVADRVHCVEPVPYKDVVPFIESADFGIYSMPNSCKNIDFCMPNKLFELTLAGLPIAIAETKDAKEYLTKTNMGLYMDGWSAESIGHAMKSLAENREKYRKTSAELDKMRRTYGWEAQVIKLQKLYQRLGATFPDSKNQRKMSEYTQEAVL